MEINLAKNLKKYRKILGLSQQKVANEANLAITVIQKIEQETATQPTIQTVLKIANVLKISIDELLGRDPKSYKSKY